MQKLKDLLAKVGGIKKNYPLILLPEKSKAYIAMCRPFTGLGAVIAGFFITMLTLNYYGLMFNIKLAFLVGITLMLLQFGGQVMNQSIKEEVEIDKINSKTYRPTVTGVVGLFEGKVFALLLFAVGSSIAFALNLMFFVFAGLLVFFAAFYSAPPLRVKRFFLLNNIWQGVSRGLLPFVAVWSIFGDPFHPLPWLLGGVVAVWVTGAQGSKDFDDIQGDRAYGIRTLPAVLGRDGAIVVMTMIMFGSFMLMPPLIAFKLLPVNFMVLLALMAPSFFIMHSLQKNWKIQILENNASWAIFYLSLALFFILPALLI